MKKLRVLIVADRVACLFVFLLTFLMLLITHIGYAQETKGVAATQKKIPIIDITDLYHPYQDPGDNFDLMMAYA